ncbi:DsbA family protein [Microbacterium thalli]|uniref:Thioredoxin domain-containing protein n=1 Tax=Microbacterium thalli TaxID=3027921 RepID=A0ABT5SGI9_9MICO|nr:thioredoxin domain-containing protein [Microbacterium thalli]MDD7929307.1 thioredoxin domain-containing protein [Microbacterium thalli]MDD7961894.1 thioredoxin domain-containing protein [Microbacterium thalli]MDN8549131.1 thioredoxin domain-containing protein [Microbacterium thalli]
MSSDDTHDAPESSAVTDRREAVREKALQVHTRQSRARIARRSGLGLLAVGAVATAAVMVTMTVSGANSRPQLEPATSSRDGFVVADVVTGSLSTDIEAQAEAPAEAAEATEAAEPAEGLPAPSATAKPPVEIRVYVDYLSAGAREWQLANSQQLTSWVDDGAVTLSYYPVAMLTAKSNGTKYSLRAASAAACVATHSPDAFYSFNNELLTRQPDIDTDGFSDTQLADMALASGVDSTKVIRECIESGSYAAWAKAATERAVAGIPDTDGLSLTGTPMVLVNGKQYIGDMGDPAEFSQFVLTTASDAYYRSAPTPTPTPTPAS